MRRLLVIGVAVLLAGCASGGDYGMPDISNQDTFTCVYLAQQAYPGNTFAQGLAVSRCR